MNTTRILARNRLSATAIAVIIISGIAPATVAAGIFPTAFGLTGITQLPLALVATTGLLMLVSVGYVAMSGRIRHTGAFYAFIAQGLSKSLGVGAGFVSLATYVMLHAALYGAIGVSTQPLMANNLGVNWPWWVWSLIVLGIVAVLGPLGIKLSKNVMVVIIAIEIMLLVVLSVAGLASPDHGFALRASFSPAGVSAQAFAIAIMIGGLSLTGFEQGAIHSESARDHTVTVRQATFASLLLMGFVYALVSWTQVVHWGPGNIAEAGLQMGPETVFQMGRTDSGLLSGGWLAGAGHVFYLTSLFGAILAFHHAGSHYFFALGRERVLPQWMADTSAHGPRAGSFIQSTIAAGIIVLYAGQGWDPQVKLFYTFGTAGGLGIMLLITATMAAVIGYYLRHKEFSEGVFVRYLAPGVSFVVLLTADFLAVQHFNDLLGAPPTDVFSTVLPISFAVIAAVGVLFGMRLRFSSPDVYERIGQGGSSEMAGDEVYSLPLPLQEPTGEQAPVIRTSDRWS